MGDFRVVCMVCGDRQVLLFRKDREETGFWINCLPIHDVMRSFFEGFATIYSLSMTSCTIFWGRHNYLAANGGAAACDARNYGPRKRSPESDGDDRLDTKTD